ncbi:MAG: hypothetical protein EOO03_02840 [Chitinophagaceae bacterium]|nr:MAG: hypothetical protein EOO03_02840 [Chitinophagaceae bacterium]
MKKLFLFATVGCMAFYLTACEKSTETLQTASIEDYSPLVVGKYVTYQLDSAVYTNFGQTAEVHSYQVRHMVEAKITDNQGRPAYRISRSIRNAAGTSPWVPDATFMAINTGNGLEFVENNLRFLKLRTPIRDYYSWKGHTFMDTYSINSEIKYLDDWDYSYDSVNVPLSIGNFAFDSTLKVDQRDEVIGNPADPNSYAEINIGVEKYAKGVGLIYRRFFHSEYQPPTPGQGGRFVDGSYGVTLTIIDHN